MPEPSGVSEQISIHWLPLAWPRISAAVSEVAASTSDSKSPKRGRAQIMRGSWRDGQALPRHMMSRKGRGPKHKRPRSQRERGLCVKRSERSGGCLSLGNLFLNLGSVDRQFVVLRLGQERVKPATVIDSPQGGSRNTQAERTAQHIRNQGHVVQVRKEPTTGFVVSVADSVARHRAFARKFADARHRRDPLQSKP